ncbi:MAG: class I adenylate cyclase, partial [Psychrosphaera sp.]|nr:class I adenylate cyclase [Psychrosphaera sp.]
GRLNYQNTDIKNPCFLKQSSDPVDLVIWCIFNRIISDRSQFYLLQSQLPIKVDDINELMTQALIDFKPIRVSELVRDDLLQPSQITHCVLVVNFSSQKSVAVVETVRVIYLTSWGEVYSLTDIVAFETIRMQFITQLDQPVCRLFTPSRNKRKVLYQWIEELIDFEFIKVM